jgi:hypothetical protein
MHKGRKFRLLAASGGALVLAAVLSAIVLLTPTRHSAAEPSRLDGTRAIHYQSLADLVARARSVAVVTATGTTTTELAGSSAAPVPMTITTLTVLRTDRGTQLPHQIRLRQPGNAHAQLDDQPLVAAGSTYLLALVPFSADPSQYVIVGGAEYQLTSGSFALTHQSVDTIPDKVSEAALPADVLPN